MALLLLLGKRVAYSFYNKGERGIQDVVNYTSRAIEDVAADFIVEKGGWVRACLRALIPPHCALQAMANHSR